MGQLRPVGATPWLLLFRMAVHPFGIVLRTMPMRCVVLTAWQFIVSCGLRVQSYNFLRLCAKFWRNNFSGK